MPLPRAHLAAQQPPNVMVFPNADGGYWAPSNFHRDVWRPLREAARIHATRFHDLRHSANTLLRELGVDGVTRARILGHSSLVNDDVYGHTTDPMLRAAAGKLNSLLVQGAKGTGQAGHA